MASGASPPEPDPTTILTHTEGRAEWRLGGKKEHGVSTGWRKARVSTTVSAGHDNPPVQNLGATGRGLLFFPKSRAGKRVCKLLILV